jgi:hypothetical protein
MPGRQPDDWGIPLWEAIERWTPKELWQRYREIKSEDLPIFILPSRPNPLEEEAGRLRARIEYVLREKLRGGELIASGLHMPLDRDSRRLDISPELWSRLKLHIRPEEASGDGLRVVELRFRRATEPKGEPAPPVDEEIKPPARKSAGRPSIMPMIEAEMRRRAERGTIEASLRREAEALAIWARRQFPDAHVPKPKSIEKPLGKLYKELNPKKRRIK